MTVILPTQLLLPDIHGADVDRLLADLTHAGVELAVVGDRLRFRPRCAVTRDLLEHLKLHKSDVIARLQPAARRKAIDNSGASGVRPHPAESAGNCCPPAIQSAAADSTHPSDSSDSGDSPKASATRVRGEADRDCADTDEETLPQARRGWAESLESPESLQLVRLSAWFQTERDSLPQDPFLLRPGCHVVHPHRFYQALDRDIAAGPPGVRARYGLQSDLTDLRNVLEGAPPAFGQASQPGNSCSISSSPRNT
jgi:hypothetical protein